MATDATFRSTTKPVNVFRGALVDLAAKHVTLSNAAECNPSPAVIPTSQAWIGVYGGTGVFTVILNDLSEYRLLLP